MAHTYDNWVTVLLLLVSWGIAWPIFRQRQKKLDAEQAERAAKMDAVLAEIRDRLPPKP
jgi:cbb3-type cytochrome oxidase subunit 3